MQCELSERSVIPTTDDLLKTIIRLMGAYVADCSMPSPHGPLNRLRGKSWLLFTGDVSGLSGLPLTDFSERVAWYVLFVRLPNPVIKCMHRAELTKSVLAMNAAGHWCHVTRRSDMHSVHAY